MTGKEREHVFPAGQITGSLQAMKGCKPHMLYTSVKRSHMPERHSKPFFPNSNSLTRSLSALVKYLADREANFLLTCLGFHL